jgi:transmembrane sensor
MKKNKLTVKELITDPSFIDHCLDDSPKETDIWAVFILENPEKFAIYNEAKQTVLMLTGKMPEYLIDEKVKAFKELFYERTNYQSSSDKTGIVKKRRLFLVAGIAASLTLLTLLIFLPLPSKHRPQYTFQNLQGKVIRTNFSERDKLTLVDGTEVILYPGSKLTISEDFNIYDRKVAVVGQVYLKISPNKGKPFIVYSSHTTTTALGTVFYVRDFENSKLSSVWLVHGKVKVTEPKRNGTIFLEPGTAMLMNDRTLEMEKKKITKDQLADLIEFKLDFNNSDMETIVKRLELFYGIQIDLNPCNCHFKRLTGDYSNRPLSAILNAIAFTNHVTWKIEGQKIVFKPDTK